MDIFDAFSDAKALCMTGSRAEGCNDEYSDTDFCVYTERIPDPEKRKETYRRVGVSAFDFLDVDLEVSKADGLIIGNRRCDILWMDLGFVESYIDRLDTDFYCDEFVPGGLLKSIALVDRSSIIPKLKNRVRLYPELRAINRIQDNVRHAHHWLFTLRWLDKAAYRLDYFSFSKYQHELLDLFITALFALNRTWSADEKRVLNIISDFDLAPDSVRQRAIDLIMHGKENGNLGQCIRHIKLLFAELCGIAQSTYPIISLPDQWK